MLVQRVNVDSDEGLKGAVEVLITEVFGETERSLSKVGPPTCSCHRMPPDLKPAAHTAVTVQQWQAAVAGSSACQQLRAR